MENGPRACLLLVNCVLDATPSKPEVARLNLDSRYRNLFSRVWSRVVNRFDRVCASDAAPVDPTSHFSLREWADLPTHHPAPDE